MSSASSERNETLRLIRGLENGSLPINDAFHIASKTDPVLVYFAMRYLRERHPPANPTSSGVVQRLVELTSTYPQVAEAPSRFLS